MKILLYNNNNNNVKSVFYSMGCSSYILFVHDFGIGNFTIALCMGAMLLFHVFK